MYFDAVLNYDYEPKFNGTPEETKAWLEDRPYAQDIYMGVCVGATMQIVPIDQYLAR